MRVKSVLACIAAVPLVSAAPEPVRLQPSSPWVVDYAKESCRLIRDFGSGKTQTKLVFESDAPGQMDMMVIGWPLETYRDQVFASYLPQASKPFGGEVAQTTDNHEPAILWSHTNLLPDALNAKLEVQQKARHLDPRVRPPAVDPAEHEEIANARRAFAAATTELSLQAGHKVVILETGSLGPAMEKFEECGQDSLKDWSIDPAVQAKIARPAWALNPDRWLFPSDYPRDMLMLGKESRIEVRLLIDASGKVTNCTSLTHFEEPEFNQVTCSNIMKRARFEPAELADGTKVPDYYVRRVVFRMVR